MPSTKSIPNSKFKKAKPNLQRYLPTGTYYARIRVAGKLHKKSLGTDVLTVAKLKLADFEKELRTQAERQKQAGKTKHGDLTVEGTTKAFVEEIANDPSLKKRTRDYYNEIIKAIRKTWPELFTMEVRAVSAKQCEAWAARLRKHGTGFQANGTKAPHKGISATRFNACVDILRRIFEPSIKEGLRYTNPTAGIKKAKVMLKHLVLPSKTQFKAMIDFMEKGQSRNSRACADMARFLAYSGCRVSESHRVLFSHINWERGEITVMGDPVTGTKNWERRVVAIIPPLRETLERIVKDRCDAKGDRPVLLVRECQKAMDRAAVLAGVLRITHHDLRHLFITTCLEAGVKIHTLANWIGHKDGGALLLKRYGHLRPEHSAEDALKVTF